MYEVFGLFVLLPVGIVLMSEDGHPGFFSYGIDLMSTAIFYIVPFI